MANRSNNENVRRSERVNKGVPPTHFGDWEGGTPLANDSQADGAVGGNRTVKVAKASSEPAKIGRTHGRSVRSGSSRSSVSRQVAQRRLEAELRAQEDLVDLEAKLAESKKLLIQKRLELEQVKLSDESWGSTFSNRSTHDDDDHDYDSVASDHNSEHSSVRVTKWLRDIGKAKHSTPKDDDNNVKRQNPEVSTAVEQIADALTQAVQSMHKQTQPNDMRRFMARNSTGKDLPTFSGTPEEWPNFIGQFRQTTTLCGFNNVENMARLQKALKGAAKEAVQAFMVVPDNVDRVIKTLERRFGRPEHIVECLIAKIQKMPAPKVDEFESLVVFADNVQNLTVTLETLKCTNHMFNPQLLKEVVAKLPAHLRMDWARHIAKTPGAADMKLLGTWLEEVADAACLVSTPKTTTAKEDTTTKKQGDKNSGQGKGKKKETVLATTAEAEDRADDKPGCLFCAKSNHEITCCKKFKGEDVDARWKWAKEIKVCFVCLRTGHRISKCKMKAECGKDDCEKPHHQLLHANRRRRPSAEKPADAEKAEVVGHTYQPKTQNRVLLRIAPVTLSGPAGTVRTYALFDEASTVTLVDDSTAKSVGATGPRDSLTMQWTNSTTKQESNSRRVSLGIVSADGCKFVIQNVRTVDQLTLPVQTVDVKKLREKWQYLRDVELPDLVNARPTILIGQDNCDLIIAREVIEGPKNGPVLSRTKLGWILHGNVAPFRGQVNEVSLHICHRDDSDAELHRLVKDSFSTEAFGVQPAKKPIRSREDVRAEMIMEKTTRRVDDRWETGLLWRDDEPRLPASKSAALKRLRSIETKMDRNPEFAQQYCSKIEEYVVKGYARKLTSEEAEQECEKTWYLPHFAVTNVHKPGKIRFVFDAAARGDGASLNDALLTGPDLLNSLPGVLCKLRQRKIGFTADIKEMFHQVRIRREDLPAQRFLWRGMDRGRLPDTMEMTVMVFGATCSPSSAQFVKNKNAQEFQEEFPDAVKAIVERHYVDDYLDSTHSEDDAERLITDVIEVHRKGGFLICNWNCSSRQVLSRIPEELRSTGNKNLDLETDIATERVLGLQWNPNADIFTFAVSFSKCDPTILSGERNPTKREVLRVVMSVFDPLGFLAHFSVKAKILMQDIWRAGIGWDDELQEPLTDKWKIWTEELRDIDRVAVPRCYSPRMRDVKTIDLHVFCDASEEAFASVAYLRLEFEDEVQTAFVMAKTRVAPLKPMSIPRLELQAAVMGSRLAQTIRDEHDLDIRTMHFWTDSRTVLCWLRSDARKFKTFVGHRVGEIEELTEGASWRWVPTKENVADDATRSGKPTEFQTDSRWWTGPPFLRRPEDEWPSEPTQLKETATEEELKKEFTAVITATADSLPDVLRFSNWRRLIRATAWMLRFLRRCRSKARTKRTDGDRELMVGELREAEVLWLKRAQWDSFPEEMSRLTDGKTISSSSRLWQLSPTIDDKGCLRHRGRIDAAPVDNCEVKQPFILDPKHPYTRLLTRHYHVVANHIGQETVVNELRQKYWILNLRTAVRSTWNSCLICKIRRTKPQVPEMGALPAVRLTPQERPFLMTGMDYFGPMEVAIGRRREKRYGVLFTCLTTRAVHLEIAASLTTDSAIMSIRRMIARRGQPKCLYSDNGTNFRGADKELREALKDLSQGQMEADLSSRGIEWHFIPPSAPHMGGSWERLVQSVKKALRATLNDRAPREEVLQTVFAEAEFSVNSRPLTHVSVDAADPEGLTPNHFLIGSSSGGSAPGMFTETDLCLRKQWRTGQRLADHFWKRWVKEYLPTLTRRTKWFKQEKDIHVDDLVFIADGDGPRNSWPRGVVTRTYPGKDGRVRVVDVKTTTGIFRRPVAKICVLDVLPELSKTQ